LNDAHSSRSGLDNKSSHTGFTPLRCNP